MTHVSTRTIESKAVKGVRFVLKRMTKRRLDALDALQTPFTERLRVIYEEFTPLDNERRAAVEAANVTVPAGAVNFPNDKLKRWSELLGQISKIDQNEQAPIAARFCLVRIEDLEITYPGEDGVDHTDPATLDLIMEHGAGPEGNEDALYQEILYEIKRECGLLPEEASNLPLPSTSAVAVDGKPDSAAPAEKPETTTPLAV